MAPASTTCSSCFRTFAKAFFGDCNEEKICLFCLTNSKLLEEVASLKIELSKLKTEIDDLRQERNVTSSPAPTTPDSPQHPATNPINVPSSKREIDEGFRYPSKRNIFKRTVYRISSSYLPIDNRFSSLAKDKEDEPPVALYGDSFTRQMSKEFCARRNRKRRRTCIPGGGIHDIDQAIQVEIKDDKREDIMILASGNDIGRRPPSELRDKYHKLLLELKNRNKNVILAGLIPRKGWSKYLMGQGKSVNILLKELCSNLQLKFLDLWNGFPLNDMYFARDDVHLSDLGHVRLGRLLDHGFLDHLSAQTRSH